MVTHFTEYFRPCIDVHEGKVKQIVGSSLILREKVNENYVASEDIEYFADCYAHHNLLGGHLIMLDRSELTRAAVMKVVNKYPGIYQVGGGMNPVMASTGKDWFTWGAAKIILSSYLFPQGKFNIESLKAVSEDWGRECLVVDLSSVWINGQYHAAIDGWRAITDFTLSPDSLSEVGKYCDEILIHAIAHEGMRGGIDENLFSLLEKASETCSVPFVYAGGIHSLDEVKMISQRSHQVGGKIGFTVGSSLDLFGGNVSLEEILKITALYR